MLVECWGLVTGLRFLEQTSQRISTSPEGKKKFKDVEIAYTSIHVVEGQNLRRLPQFSRDKFR